MRKKTVGSPNIERAGKGRFTPLGKLESLSDFMKRKDLVSFVGCRQNMSRI